MALTPGTGRFAPARMTNPQRYRKEKPMNILLLYPEFPDTFWSFKHALKFVRKKASLPPLGLLTVASMLPPAWQRRLVDLNVRKRDRKSVV